LGLVAGAAPVCVPGCPAGRGPGRHHPGPAGQHPEVRTVSTFTLHLTRQEADALLRALDLVAFVETARNRRRERPDVHRHEESAEQKLRMALGGRQPEGGTDAIH